MLEDYESYNIQRTAHGFVVTASISHNGRPEAWTARTIDDAAFSIVNDYNMPKTTQTKGN